MKEFYKLIIPEKVEIILFLSVTVGFLLLQNIKRFWMLLQGDTVVIAKQTNSFGDAASNWVTTSMNNVSPRLVDFLLWALIGCVVFVFISVIIAFIKSLDGEAELLHYYQSPKGRAHEINSFLTKMAIRLIGIVSISLWFFYFVGVANPAISNWFFTATGSLSEPSSWLWLSISIILLACCLYVFAVLARLVALKPRIFGTDSE